MEGFDSSKEGSGGSPKEKREKKEIYFLDRSFAFSVFLTSPGTLRASLDLRMTEKCFGQDGIPEEKEGEGE